MRLSLGDARSRDSRQAIRPGRFDPSVEFLTPLSSQDIPLLPEWVRAPFRAVGGERYRAPGCDRGVIPEDRLVVTGVRSQVGRGRLWSSAQNPRRLSHRRGTFPLRPGRVAQAGGWHEREHGIGRHLAERLAGVGNLVFATAGKPAYLESLAVAVLDALFAERLRRRHLVGTPWEGRRVLGALMDRLPAANACAILGYSLDGVNTACMRMNKVERRYNMNYLLITLLWIAYCVLHSYLISTRFTNLASRLLRRYYAFYRLFYVALSLVLLIPLLDYTAQMKSEIIVTYGHPLSVVRHGLTGAALLLFFWAFFFDYDSLSFFGIRQMLDFGKAAASKPSAGLKRRGLLGVTRHPMYLALIVYLWCQTFRTVDVILNTVLTIYVIVGTRLEEKKLGLEFGDSYRKYQQEVPMLIPFTKAKSR